MTRLKKIRILTAFFIAGLFISGITCFPIKQEVEIGINLFEHWQIDIPNFVQTVEVGIQETTLTHPFLFYGTDWLGFAHILFALLFYGVYKDPIKNKWVTEFGIIACIAIFPLALIMGPIRSIPFWWQLVDCSFGIIGLMCIVPVYLLTHQIIKDND